MTSTEEIRKLLEQGKLVIGLRSTRRALEEGVVDRVMIAANAPELEADAVKGYALMSEILVETLDARSEQLGTVCRKPFSISFLSVLK